VDGARAVASSFEDYPFIFAKLLCDFAIYYLPTTRAAVGAGYGARDSSTADTDIIIYISPSGFVSSPMMYRSILYELDVIGMYINRREFNKIVNTAMLPTKKEKRDMPNNIRHPIYQYISRI